MRHWNGISIALLGVSILLSGMASLEAQIPADWRTYKTSDGLPDSLVTSVTISPRGNVWTKNGEFGPISRLDGYHIQNFPPPPVAQYRVYESRSGQLWSLYAEGLMTYDQRAKEWRRFPIAAVRQELETNLLWQLRPVLVPGIRNEALVILSGQLFEYNTTFDRMTVLRTAATTPLGTFEDMAAAPDGGIWITGENGLAKVPGPVHKIRPRTPWQFFLCPPALGLHAFQRPMGDESGGVTMIAQSRNREDRVAVRFDGHSWKVLGFKVEKLRSAWMAEKGVYWAQTINALVRLDHGNREAYSGQFYDVAVEPRNVFWTATAEGLVRVAPLPWRTPRGPAALHTMTHAILEQGREELWFATATGLVRLKGTQWQVFPWPEDFEPVFHYSDNLYQLADGDLVISAENRSLRFDPKTGQFHYLLDAQTIQRVAGQLPGGDLIIVALDRKDPDRISLKRYGNHRLKPFPLPSPPLAAVGPEIYFYQQTSNGEAWLGGSGGLAVCREGQWQAFNRAEGFVGGRALCLLELADGKIWCSNGSEILEYDGKRWTVVRSGLDRVTSMIQSRDGAVWLASNSGVIRYANGSWVGNSVEEGLPSQVVYKVWQDQQDRMWVGTALGLAQYYPGADVAAPVTTVTQARPTPDEGSGLVVLVFHGHDKWKFTPENRLLYTYKLDRGGWTPYSTENRVELRDLAAGRHRVAVRAMDRNWNQEAEPVVYSFVTVVPWYRDPRLVVVSIFGLLVTLFFAGLAVNRHLKLVRSYANIERIVDQRTRQLQRANEELLHSQKMKALGTLAAGIAHDFNNLLSIIKGSVQIIENNLDRRSKVEVRLSRIKTAVDQGTAIVRSILGLSRASRESQRPCVVNEVVDQTIKLLGDRFLQDVRVRFRAGEGLPVLRGSPDLLHQVLLNLMINAADAMGGHGEIGLGTEMISELPSPLILPPARASGYVALSVLDSGHGIAPEVLPRIFEPFFTTKALSSRRGTGLGLSMVYEICKELGYGLEVVSEVGHGSRFTVLLPVLPPEKAQEHQQ